MIEVRYNQRNPNTSKVEPMGWRGHVDASRHVVLLPIDSDARSLCVCLHEFAHVLQIEGGWLTEERYVGKHELFIEAEASAIALAWVKPEHYQTQFHKRSYDLCTFGKYAPRSYYSMKKYLQRHCLRIERMWRR